MLVFVLDELLIFLFSHAVVWTQQRNKKGKVDASTGFSSGVRDMIYTG